MTSETVSWTALRDLPATWEESISDELSALRDVWSEQAQELGESQALAEFNARLAREWAIETGILEQLYTIDEGVSRLLIEQGLHSSLIPHGTTDQDPEYVMALVKDQHRVVDWLFDFVRAEREVSTTFIKEMHQLMTRHQDTTSATDSLGRSVKVELTSGDWRTLPTKINRMGDGEYVCCPPEQIGPVMTDLVRMSQAHFAEKVPAEVEAAWLHHRFTEVHPFQDGNGRVARALATLAFLREGFFPLVIRRIDREEYLQALYYADAGDLSHLVDLFTRLQKRAFVAALGLSREVLHEKAGLADIVAAAADRLQEKALEHERRMSEVFGIAGKLLSLAEKQFQGAANMIHQSVSNIDKDFRAWSNSASNDSERDDYFRFQIIAAAKQLGYFANTRTYRAWCRLSIVTEAQTDIIVSLHCVGSEFKGVMVASALSYRRERTGEDATAVSDIETLSSEPFLFNYNNIPAAVETRFGKWLDEAVTLGLDKWRRSL